MQFHSSEKIKRLSLTNVITKKTLKHNLGEEHSEHNIITYYELLEIIELYEPMVDVNKILLQVKIDGRWQYASNKFSVNVWYSDIALTLEVRYKVYAGSGIEPAQRDRIKNSLEECQRNLGQFERKFDLNHIDINLMWASPLYTVYEKERKQSMELKFGEKLMLRWRTTPQKYIKQIADTLASSDKRIFVRNILFNEDSFSSRDQYAIVYLMCHTECYSPKKPATVPMKRYFAGETYRGELCEITPEKMQEMMQGKSIQLLVLHSSYPYFHMDVLRKCKGIKNILLINSNPLHNAQPTNYFLKTFFRLITSGCSIKESHCEAMSSLLTKFKKDEICCCYHDHSNEKCIHYSNFDYFRFHSTHYKSHYILKKPDQCCSDMAKYEQTHKTELKYCLIAETEQYGDMKFSFENGELEGDIFYFKSFVTRENLLGNRMIFIKSLEIFAKDKSKKSFSMFNIYSRIEVVKKIFVESLVNYLIRRKTFAYNQVYEVKSLKQLKIQNYKDTLNTVYCQAVSSEQLDLLKQLPANILLVTAEKPDLSKSKTALDSVYIEPLTEFDCNNYIKAQRHLEQRMKDKVGAFWKLVWNQESRQIYYPPNFDYEGLMMVIAESNYDKAGNNFLAQIDKFVDNRLLDEYIVFMSVVTALPASRISEIEGRLTRLKFFKKDNKALTRDLLQFFNRSRECFNLVFQKMAIQIQPILVRILSIFVGVTYQSSQGSALYEATTDSEDSLISIAFRQSIEQAYKVSISKQLRQYLQKIPKEYILHAGLNIVRLVFTCFYFYEIFTIGQSAQSLQQGQTQKKKVEELSLLLINNAIVHGKNSQHLKSYIKNLGQCEENDEQEDEEKYMDKLQNAMKDGKSPTYSKDLLEFTSQDFAGLYHRASHEKESEADYMLPSSQDEAHRKYGEKDFIKPIQYLEASGLIFLLSKIRSKQPSPVIGAVVQALHLQILIEEIYLTSYYDANQVKNGIRSLILIFKEKEQNEVYKFRMLYDVVTSLIVMYTQAGRTKICYNKFINIKSNFKMALTNQAKKIISNCKLEPTFMKILEKLCQHSQIYAKITEYLKICNVLCNLGQNRRKLMKGYEQALSLWEEFNEIACSNNQPDQQYQSYKEDSNAASFLKLLDLKLRLKQKMSSPKQMQAMTSYSYNMLMHLSQTVQTQLQEIKRGLVVVLVASPLNQKGGSNNNYMVDYSSIINLSSDKKKISSGPVEAPKVLNSKFSAQQIKTTICKMSLNRKNLAKLAVSGCRCLILAFVPTDYNNNIFVGEKDDTKTVQLLETAELAGLISNISCLYCYFCLQKPDLLKNAIKGNARERILVYFDYERHKELPLDEAQRHVLMLTISLFINHSVNAGYTLNDSVNQIQNNLQVDFSTSKKINELVLRQVNSIVKYDDPDFSLSKPAQDSSINSAIRVQISESFIIKKDCLRQIENIQFMDLRTEEDLKKKGYNLKGCSLETFINGYKLFLREKKELDIQVLENSSEASKFFERLLGVLPDYHLKRKLALIIKNFSLNLSQNWQKQVIKGIIFSDSNGKFINQLVKSCGETCLISIRDSKRQEYEQK